MTCTDRADLCAVARFQQWCWQFNRFAVGTVLSAVGIRYEWRVFRTAFVPLCGTVMDVDDER